MCTERHIGVHTCSFDPIASPKENLSALNFQRLPSIPSFCTGNVADGMVLSLNK